MSASKEQWGNDIFAREIANQAAMEAAKRKPVTVRSYFEALDQWGDARHDLVMFGGKYGATRFAGPFDLRKLMKVYMSDPETRAEINRIAGVG